MSIAKLDHLVIAAENLKQGEDYISSKLGVKPVPGGKHPKQGTHNSLLKLGNKRYLEVIAIDPNGVRPQHPRWFNLDSPDLQKSITKRPRLIGWVARTTDMKMALSRASYNPGSPKKASRGNLRWTFTFTADGSLIEMGLLPPLIAWESDSHPADSLPDSHIKIAEFEAFHPKPKFIKRQLESLGLQDDLDIHNDDMSQTRLSVTLNTPEGTVRIDGLVVS